MAVRVIEKRRNQYRVTGSLWVTKRSRLVDGRWVDVDLAVVAKIRVNWWGVWAIVDGARGPLLKELKTFPAARLFAESIT